MNDGNLPAYGNFDLRFVAGIGCTANVLIDVDIGNIINISIDIDIGETLVVPIDSIFHFQYNTIYGQIKWH